MRLITWNCQMAFDKKRSVIDSLSPHVAVIQEISRSAQLLAEPNVSSLWRTPGKSESKGLAVLGFGGWTVEPLPAPVDLPWILPCSVHQPDGRHWANLLAVWTHKSKGDSRPAYAEQFHRAIDVWAEIISASPTLMVGDLNASLQGLSREGQEESLRRIAALDLVSAYHSAMNVDHGSEPDMTLKWVGPGKRTYFYHCDFIFAPRGMTSGLAASVHPLFLLHDDHVSDHQPVVADFAY